MKHAHSDSDATSLALSSPRSSPKRPLYFVQSPSRDSHDGEKLSSRATPGYNSPTDSPSHSSAFASSTSRISGAFNPWKLYRKRSGKGWPDRNVIDEESEYVSDRFAKRRRYFHAALGLVLMFVLFCFIIWGASKPYKPQIAVKSLKMNAFSIGEGSDHTGVPTMIMTLNCTVKMIIHNPATFFGIYMRSSPFRLFYSQVSVATGQLKKYHQPRKSQRIVFVKMEGYHVPLYGAGGRMPLSRIPMRFKFELLSQGNIVGTLVKAKNRMQISCWFILNKSDTKAIKFKKDACTYRRK